MSSEYGFTLLEVVVALAVMVVSLGGLYTIIQTSMERDAQSASRSRALAIAQSTLAESIAMGRFVDESGVIDDYRWAVAYEAREVPDSARQQWQLNGVEVTVTWDHRAREESLVFATSRIGPNTGAR